MRSLEEIEDRNSAVIKSFASILKRNIKDIIKFSSVIEKRGYIKDGQYSKKTDVVWADTKKEIKRSELLICL
jgi:hypothetical protein